MIPLHNTVQRILPHHLYYAVNQALSPHLPLACNLHISSTVRNEYPDQFYYAFHLNEKKVLSGGESNPALPRDRRVY